MAALPQNQFNQPFSEINLPLLPNNPALSFDKAGLFGLAKAHRTRLSVYDAPHMVPVPM